MVQRFFYSHRVLLLLIFASALLGILRFNSFQVGAFVDDAHYVVLSESLASGQGYSLINFPGGYPERDFPPGWPLLLTPLTYAFPGNYTVLKLLPFTLWLISIVLVYELLAKPMATPYTEILAALVALNPMLVGASGMLMSEVAFLFFTLLTLNLFEYWNDPPDNRPRVSDGLLILVAVIAFFAQTIRTVGIAMLLAIIVYLLLKRRFRQFGIFVAVVAIGLLFQMWFNAENGGGLITRGYEEQVLGNISPDVKMAHMWENAQSYLNGMILDSLAQIFGPNSTAILNRFGLGFVLDIVNAGILLLIMLGITFHIHNYRLSDLYVGFYFLGILSFWNPETGNAQARFLIPIIPFLYAYLFQGVLWLAAQRSHPGNKYILAVVIGFSGLILLISAARNLQDWRDPIRNRMIDLSIGRTWIQQNSSPESVILARDPIPDYLYTRRKTVAYPQIHQNIQDYVRDYNIDYIILSPKLRALRSVELDNFTKSQLLSFIEKNPQKFRLVFENSAHGVWVYQVVED